MASSRTIWINLAIAILFSAVLGGCGSGSTTSVPATASIFYAHSLAFRNTTTFAWGYNGFGQVGLDPTNSSNVTVTTPRPVAGLTGVIGLSLGADHSIAFMNNSTVRAWGYNGFNQLGASTGNLTYSVTPVKVGTISGITAVSAGGDHNLALQNNGTVWAWGSNAVGQIGAGPSFQATTTGTTPQHVIDGTTGAAMVGVTAIAAGGSHSLALKADGTLWAWGDNTYGQLGTSSVQSHSSEPQQVQVIENGAIVPVAAIAAGGAFSLALDGQGRVWAWGYNGLGQLGVDPATTPTLFRSTPQLVPGLSGVTVTAIATGLDHALVLVGDTLKAWGYNNFGQLGNNTTATMSFNPVTVVNASGVTFSGVQQIIAAAGHHNIVRTVDTSGVSHVFAWGDNGYGQIGDGTTTNRSVPTLVSGF